MATEGFLSIPSPGPGFHLQVTTKQVTTKLSLFFIQIDDKSVYESHVFISSFSLFYLADSQTGNQLFFRYDVFKVSLQEIFDYNKITLQVF